MIRLSGTFLILIAGFSAFAQNEVPVILAPPPPAAQAPVVLDLAPANESFAPEIAQTAAQIENSPCETKDLNLPENESPLYRMPIHDQDGTGACYAYAATQLVDYERMMQYRERGDWEAFDNYSLNQRISPLWTAYSAQYASKVNKQTVSLGAGGNVEDAIDSLKKTGVCSERKVQTSLSKLKSEASLPGQPRMTDAQLVYLTDSLHRQHLGVADAEQTRIIASAWMPNCNVAKFTAFWNGAGANKVASVYIFDYLFGKCKTDRLKIRRQLSTRRTGSDADMQDAIEDKFKVDRPVVVNLCEDVLRNPARRGLNKTFRLRDAVGNKNSQCGGGQSLHSVLIVGQKKIGGSCNYLVRNSWGANWAPQGATTCSCIRSNDRYDDNCSPNDPNDKRNVKEYVGCWYKRGDLLPNIGAVNGY